MAPRTPTSIVAPATHNSSVPGRAASGTCSVWLRISAYTPTFVSRPASTAVTAAGAAVEVGHVDGAGGLVHERQRHQEQRRGHQAHDHVGHAGAHLAGTPAQREQ